MSKDELDGVPPLSRNEPDLRTKAAEVMSEGKAMTAGEIAKAANEHEAAVLKALKHLVDAGAAVREDGRYRLLSSEERG